MILKSFYGKMLEIHQILLELLRRYIDVLKISETTEGNGIKFGMIVT